MTVCPGGSEVERAPWFGEVPGSNPGGGDHFYFFYFLFLGVILSAECIGDGLNHLNFHQAAVSMVSVGTIINVVLGLSHSYRDLKIYT